MKGYDRMLSVSRDKTDPKWKPIHVPASFKSRERRISKLLVKTNWFKSREEQGKTRTSLQEE